MAKQLESSRPVGGNLKTTSSSSIGGMTKSPTVPTSTPKFGGTIASSADPVTK